MSEIIPIGPYHPLQEEPEFFKLHVEGERVTKLDIEIGYNHRGIEKLAESKSWDQVVFLVERICGICSTSHPAASVNAMEDAAGINAPERAQFIRMIVCELERIHSHLLWLGLAGHFIGYNTVWMWSWKYREIVCDVLEKISGNRQSYAMFKAGGVRRDILDEDIPWIRSSVDKLIPALDLFKGAVMDDPVIHARTKGIGILTEEMAKAYCVVGPTARASNVAIDVRRDDPYFLYDQVDFDVIVLGGGDVFDKAAVRILEMYESVKIIKQSLDLMKPGIVDLHIKEIPPGEGIGRAEAPRGEVYHYCLSDGSNFPARYKVRAPSYVNIFSNEVACIGQQVADAALVLAAVDPCYCCTERLIVVDNDTNKTREIKGNALIQLSHQRTEEIKKSLGIS
ncbi:nickel-dependent hydrogenase large subunit [bacterium]|nr:nickel-dependent hydrogenase large subunit [bacterium]